MCHSLQKFIITQLIGINVHKLTENAGFDNTLMTKMLIIIINPFLAYTELLHQRRCQITYGHYDLPMIYL